MIYEYVISTINDYDEIITIKNQVKKEVEKAQLPIWLNGYPDDLLIKEDIENKMGRMIKVNNQIVAYLSYYKALYDYDPGTFPDDDVMSFGRVMTKVSEQGHGYASILISEVIKEAKANKEKGIGILVDEINTKAVNLYKKHGFKKIGKGTFPWAVLDIYLLEF